MNASAEDLLRELEEALEAREDIIEELYGLEKAREARGDIIKELGELNDRIQYLGQKHIEAVKREDQTAERPEPATFRWSGNPDSFITIGPWWNDVPMNDDIIGISGQFVDSLPDFKSSGGAIPIVKKAERDRFRAAVNAWCDWADSKEGKWWNPLT